MGGRSIHSMVDKDSNGDSICVRIQKWFHFFAQYTFCSVKCSIAGLYCTHIRMLMRLSSHQLVRVHFQVNRFAVFPKPIVVALQWQQLVRPVQRLANRVVAMRLEWPMRMQLQQTKEQVPVIGQQWHHHHHHDHHAHVSNAQQID